MPKTEIKVDDSVLLKNSKRFDRKGGKFSQKWFGPYTVINISDKGVGTLKTHREWLLRINTTLFNLNTTFNEQTTNQNQHQMQNLQIFGIMHQTTLLRWFFLYAMQQSENSFPGHKCKTYASIKSTCRKWARIIEAKGPALLLKIYIDTWKPLGKPYNENIIVNTPKLTSIFWKIQWTSQPTIKLYRW